MHDMNFKRQVEKISDVKLDFVANEFDESLLDLMDEFRGKNNLKNGYS